MILFVQMVQSGTILRLPKLQHGVLQKERDFFLRWSAMRFLCSWCCERPLATACHQITFIPTKHGAIMVL